MLSVVCSRGAVRGNVCVHPFLLRRSQERRRVADLGTTSTDRTQGLYCPPVTHVVGGREQRPPPPQGGRQHPVRIGLHRSRGHQPSRKPAVFAPDVCQHGGGRRREWQSVVECPIVNPDRVRLVSLVLS